MATPEQIATLRRMADEPLADPYTDDVLSAMLAASGSLDAAAAVVWREKAAKVADLVQTSESGSSRANQQIHANYLKMAESYEKKTAVVVSDVSSAPFTVGSERV